jgi:MOSC domain-containing protein YiiM
MARIDGIYVWPVSKGDPRILDEVFARQGGLDGDRKRSAKRQVTLLDAAAWAAATREVGCDAAPMWRRANLVVSGLTFTPEMFGRKLRVGDVVVRVHGETDPCSRMDDLHPGLRAAMAPDLRGGLHGSIETEGTLRLGDEVSLLDD